MVSATFQTRALEPLVFSAVATVEASAEIAITLTPRDSALQAARWTSVEVSQSRTMPSLPAVAMVEPSALVAMTIDERLPWGVPSPSGVGVPDPSRDATNTRPSAVAAMSRAPSTVVRRLLMGTVLQ